MYRSTHVFVGAAFGLWIGGSSPWTILYAFFGGLGGYFPDLDLRYKHRKFLHNIFVPLLLSFILYIMINILISSYNTEVLNINNTISKYIALSFFMGYMLHILMDSLTKVGVYILYPVSNIRLRIPLFRSSSLWANGLGFMFGGLFIYLWLDKIGINRIIEKIISFLQ